MSNFIMVEHKESIRFFNDREVRAVWDEEHSKWWFSVLDIIAAINEQDDYQKKRNYRKYLKTKLRKENSQLVSATNQLKLKASDGKSYKTDTFDSEGEPFWQSISTIPRQQAFLTGSSIVITLLTDRARISLISFLKVVSSNV